MTTTTKTAFSHVFPRTVCFLCLLPSSSFPIFVVHQEVECCAKYNFHNNKKISLSHVLPGILFPVLFLPLLVLCLPFSRSSSLSPNTRLLFSPTHEDANNYLRGRDTTLPALTVSYEQGHTRNYVPSPLVGNTPAQQLPRWTEPRSEWI